MYYFFIFYLKRMTLRSIYDIPDEWNLFCTPALRKIEHNIPYSLYNKAWAFEYCLQKSESGTGRNVSLIERNINYYSHKLTVKETWMKLYNLKKS